jgi:hypothetical protein
MDIVELSFIASRDGKVLPKAKKDEMGRCFWHVRATGEYGADCDQGSRLALEYLSYEENKGPNSPTLLPHIIGDMPRPLGGVEIGFLTLVGFAAEAGANRARGINAYWDTCREREHLK